MTWHDLNLRLRALLRLKRTEEDLDDELQFHLEMEARKNVAQGVPESEARRRARLHFGGMDQHKEECRTARGTVLVESTFRDIRYALRGFLRTPGFALTVIGTIALALGLNTAVFTIFNAYVLRPMAVRDPNSLYEFMPTNREERRQSLSWAAFQEFQSANSAFTSVTGTAEVVARVDRQFLSGELVTGNYFQMLGVQAAFGRTLLPEDCCASGSHPVIVLTHAAWQNMFGADPGIIGRKILMRGHPLEVIGVIQPGFTGVGELPRDFWVPFSMAPQLTDAGDIFRVPGAGKVHLIGRLKPELSLEQAKASLLSLSQAQNAARPDAEKVTGGILYPQATRAPLSWEMAAALSPVVVAFGLVLVIACTNVGNMMLSRMLARQKEIGIRLSLGAARFRLIRQLLTECLILSVAAGGLALLLSQLAIHYGQSLFLGTMPVELIEFIRIEPLSADLRVFLFMMLAAAASTLLFGLAPALQVTRSSLVSASRGNVTNDHRPERLRGFLIVSQVTCCVLLLISVTVLLRAAARMQEVDIGVQPRSVILMEVLDAFRPKVLETLRTHPSVVSIASAASVPLAGSTTMMTPLPGNTPANTPYNLVSPEYLPMLEVPILKGRNFTEDESRSAAPVAIVSASTADRFFPNQDPLGRTIQIGDKKDPHLDKRLSSYATVRVVGVSGDVTCGSRWAKKAGGCVFLPAPLPADGTSIFVKVNQDAETARQKLDMVLAERAPGSIQQIFKLNAFLEMNMYPFRAATWVCGALGVVALLLTISGVYGVLAYLVTQRTREIGIRVALGATNLSVIALVLKQSIRYSVRGAVIGTALALAIAQLLASHLTTIDPFDVGAYASGILTVIAAALAAAYFPSRRAARVEPAITLRCD